jgi:hypothetical protein
MNLKWLSLVILIFQNVSIVLVTSYSRTYSQDKTSYLASSAVVMSELVKLIFSFLGYKIEEKWVQNQKKSKNKSKNQSSLFDKLFGFKSEWQSLCIPALLYFVQNNLIYQALGLVRKHYHLLFIIFFD